MVIYCGLYYNTVACGHNNTLAFGFVDCARTFLGSVCLIDMLSVASCGIDLLPVEDKLTTKHR